jgi:hypothetical protein
MSLKNSISLLVLLGLATAIFASEEMRTGVVVAAVENGDAQLLHDAGIRESAHDGGHGLRVTRKVVKAAEK